VYTPADGADLVDLAAAPDGRHLSLIAHLGADWRVLEIDLGQPAAAPRVLLRRAAPMHALHHGKAGLELIADVDGVYNVWRLQTGTLHRLTHSHTAVVAHAGTAADGSLASVVVVAQGYALHRLAGAASLQGVAATAPAAVVPPAPAAAPVEPAPLAEGRSYSALRALYPRSWLPAVTADRGLTAYGASTTGGDALGWHRYAVLAQWETSQKELLGSLEYLYLGNHGLALSRTLSAQAWTGSGSDERTTVYDRRTQAQWLSLLPWTRLERRVNFGLGAALDRIDRVDLDAATTARPRDERVLAALVDVDTSNEDWASEGPNRGWRGTLLYESYKPFSHGGAPDFDGAVLRTDLRGYLPLGRTVLALRVSDAHASGRTEPYQLGGATDETLQIGYVLDYRRMALRGYRGTEPDLVGRNARVASAEWRTPLADIDRHGMVPPLGIDRLSAAFFFDIGGAWDSGSSPSKWRRGVGLELLGEVKLLYALALQLRLGVARGLDEPRSSRGYLTLGRAF
jgi:hypothetical protein